MNVRIAPSLLAADFASLASELGRAEAAGADLLHVDVMDGHFVDNITIGPPVVAALRRRTRLPLDVHLMIEDPEKYLGAFLDAGADILSVHLECFAAPRALRRAPKGFTIDLLDGPLVDFERLDRVLAKIHSSGRRASVALNPDTLVEIMERLPERVEMVLVMTVWPGFGGQAFLEPCLDKVKKLRTAHPSLDIQVDGGISSSTVGSAVRAGANVIVAGTATFGSGDFNGALRDLRARAQGLSSGMRGSGAEGC